MIRGTVKAHVSYQYNGSTGLYSIYDKYNIAGITNLYNGSVASIALIEPVIDYTKAVVVVAGADYGPGSNSFSNGVRIASGGFFKGALHVWEAYSNQNTFLAGGWISVVVYE